MPEKQKEAWIKITLPDGEHRIASPSYITNLLGLELHNQYLDYIYRRLQRIESDITKLRKPERKRKILNLLRKEQNTPHNSNWFSRRIPNFQHWDLQELVAEDELEWAYSGTVQMFRLTEKGWKQE